MSIDAAVVPAGAGRPSRRTLLAGAIWATPVIMGLTATPAFAVSGPDEPPPPAPVNEIVVQAYNLWNGNEQGQPGPLGWSGGQIRWDWSPSGRTSGTLTYTVLLTKPNGTTETLKTGAKTVTPVGTTPIAELTWGTAPLPRGKYTLTVTVVGGGGSASDSTSLTL